MSKCAHCPCTVAIACPGEGARRLCDLVDPEHPAYRPGYLAVIPLHAHHTVPSVDAVLAAARAEMGDQTFAVEPRTGCCG